MVPNPRARQNAARPQLIPRTVQKERAMKAALFLGLALLLAGCGEISLALPTHVVAPLSMGCESQAPIGKCSVSGFIHYRKEF